MKLFTTIIFAGCLLVNVHGLFGPGLQAKLRAREDKCLEETNTRLYLVDRLRITYKMPEDGRLDKFAICMLYSYRILNKDGTVNPDTRSYYLISDVANKWRDAEKCVELAGENKTESVRKIMRCLLGSDISIIDSQWRSPKVPRPMRN